MFMLAGLCPSVVFVNLYCLCSEMLEKIGPHSASSLPTVSSTDGGFSAVPALDLLDILQAPNLLRTTNLYLEVQFCKVR